jgi:hypothetical protein
VNLQQRLNRACTIAIDSPPEAYAAEALAVFVAWLREHAIADAMSGETMEYHWLRADLETCACYEWHKDDSVLYGQHVARVELAWLAGLVERGEL